MIVAVENHMKGRLIIVDPSLRDTRGHHYALTRVIADSAVNSGFEVVVFSNRSLDSRFKISGAQVRPVFSKATYDYFISTRKTDGVSLKEKLHLIISLRLPESLKIILRKIRSKFKKIKVMSGLPDKYGKAITSNGLQDELQGALIKENVTSVDHVLVHTADGMTYRVILQLLQNKYPFGEYPSFHLCTPYDMRVMPHSANGLSIHRVVGYLDKMGFIGRNVFLYAENELLTKSLSSVWGVDVSTLDIPMKVMAPQVSPALLDKDDVFRVIYLGAAREEKGFHLIPDIIEVVLNGVNKAPRVEFIIQCSPQIIGYPKKIELVVDRLKCFQSTDVRLIQQQQSESDYYSVLESADVVLCCYQQENYRVRGSGIATEAVAYGKTLITTPGTYPEWLAGDAGLSASGSRKIGEAILFIIKNREACKIKAVERAEWFFKSTKPDEYVSKLLARERSAKINKEFSSQGSLVKTFQDSREMTSQVEDQDVTGCENKYNHQLGEADMSCDGKMLFIKKVSERRIF